MSAVLSPVFIEQARLRSFERPLEAVVLGLAGIDLHAVSDHLERQRGPLRRRYRRFVGANRRRGADEQDARHGAMNQFSQFCLHRFGMDAISHLGSFASAAGYLIAGTVPLREEDALKYQLLRSSSRCSSQRVTKPLMAGRRPLAKPLEML
jgi:hypothetical protein